MSRRSSDEQVRDHDSELDEKTVEGKVDREKDPEKGLGPAVDSEPEPKAPSKVQTRPDLQAWQTLVGSYVFEDFIIHLTLALSLECSWLIIFVGFGYMNAFGVYQGFCEEDFHRNNTHDYFHRLLRSGIPLGQIFVSN